jgi:hypothetical protein
MDGKFDPGGKLQIDGPREAPLFLPVVLPSLPVPHARRA